MAKKVAKKKAEDAVVDPPLKQTEDRWKVISASGGVATRAMPIPGCGVIVMHGDSCMLHVPNVMIVSDGEGGHRLTQ